MADRIGVVSGLPRSGTSLMMQILAAGGMPILTDHLRAADTANPKGYFEFEPVKRLKEGDRDWLSMAEGKAVKVISALLVHLPTNYQYDVIFMQRTLCEVLASQSQLLIQRGQVSNQTSDQEMAQLYEKHLAQVAAWLDRQVNIRTLYINYNTLIQTPDHLLVTIQEFLGRPLDKAAMLAQIEPGLYRNRI